MDAGHNPVGTELRERLGLIPLERDADSRPLTAADVRLRRPIGEIFVELGFITQGQLEGALAVQKTTGARIGEILVEQGILTRLDLASALAEHWESGQPEAPVVWPSPGNGAPVTPLPEPGLVAGDAAAIVELEPRLELAEDRVEPARPARRRWRRSVRVDDALATEARLAAVEAAIRDVAGRGMPAGDSAEQRRTDRPDALITRLELLERRLEALAVLEKRVVVLAASTVELGAELHALTDRPPGTEPRHQLSELAQRVESIEIEGRERLGMLNAAVSDLGRRLDEQAAIGEEQARASEWAIREGLASLHEGLTGAEPEFSTDGKEPGPLERLGAAVVAVDARMADRGPVSKAEGFVAFAPTASGYRLVELPGGLPEIGSTLVLDVCDGPFVVTRHGRSPLPFDRRPCAYLGCA